ncbi:MAG: HNH endonuclease [Kiritimatiellae bacterium]|nr:HNH endonuclease [Kiritimatiellia bacterium]
MARNFGGGSWVDIQKDDAHVRRERDAARALRASAWWKGVLQKGICHYCGGRFPPEELTMDHIVPVSRGGFSRKGNVVPCCRACNASKGAATPAERILDSLGLAEEESGLPPEAESRLELDS